MVDTRSVGGSKEEIEERKVENQTVTAVAMIVVNPKH